MLLLPEELAFRFHRHAQNRVDFGEGSGVLEREHVVVPVPVGKAVVGAGEIGVEDLFSPGQKAEFAVHVRFRFALGERGRAISYGREREIDRLLHDDREKTGIGKNAVVLAECRIVLVESGRTFEERAAAERMQEIASLREV